MLADDERRMSGLVRRLRRQIMATGDFACFAERVSAEEAVFAYASAIGVNVCELLRAWAGAPEAGTRKRTPPPTTTNDDDDVLPPDDDDDDFEKKSDLYESFIEEE